jgi:transcriptional regulator
MTENLSLLKGTVDLLILKALERGPRHGYAVAEWIDAATGGTLLVEEGTLYPALHRLERKRWVEADWGQSENKRRARFYQLTVAGRKRLASESRDWERYANAVGKALATEGDGA